MRRVFLVLAAAALVMGGSACSDDADPEAAPPDPPTPAVSTTPASGPVAPTLPPEAEGDDAAAAEAFVEYFWEVVNYAEQSGDTTGLVPLAMSSCDACRGGANSIREVHDAGGSFVGGKVSVLSSKAVRLGSRGVAFGVSVELVFQPQDVRVPGEPRKRYEGGEGEYQFILQQVDGSWRVARWDSMS